MYQWESDASDLDSSPERLVERLGAVHVQHELVRVHAAVGVFGVAHY